MIKDYNSELHKFVESYFSIIEASIIEKQNNFFIVEYKDGSRKTYTYVARVAAENKDITLLAKGSAALNKMIKECTQIGGFSEVDAIYTDKTISSTLCPKDCCDLCPFFTICENKGKCCDFCSYYKTCNTSIINADFVKLGDIRDSQPLDILCFRFLVELSNDYSLSQKVEKFVTVLIDIKSKKTIHDICFDGISGIEIIDSSATTSLDEKEYHNLLSIARKEAHASIKNQLEVFKKEIEDTLKDKIKSIIDKYEEEYIENYTKSTLEQLDNLQEEGLKLCERELRGYAINCDYHLTNVILMHTSKDVRYVTFRQHSNNAEIDVSAEIFLNRINIRCSECHGEIDVGAVCDNGHIICKNCMDICSACGKIICSVCDEESYICSTCGEVICTDCSTQCASCDAIVCPSHSYRCTTCGNVFCIDCYEICNVCGCTICSNHANTCSTCSAYVCSDHIHKCAVCNTPNCDDHIYYCEKCNDALCEEHAYKSHYSQKIICEKHSAKCTECNEIFAMDELSKCTLCSLVLCPEHIKTCSNCSKKYCAEHINHCKACGKDYCTCTQSVKCKLCKETYCPSCVNDNGICKACESLKYLDTNLEEIQDILEKLPHIAKYKKFYIGRSNEANVLYAKNLMGGHMIVFDNNKEIISVRKISWLEFIRTKILK